MLASLIVASILGLSAHAQSETPPAAAPGATKAPGMLPMPPNPSDTKIKGDECAAEAKTASCKGSIDMNLLQCMMKYKKEHKEFSVSPTCRVAIQKWHMSQKH